MSATTPKVNFHNEHVDFQMMEEKVLSTWTESVIQSEGKVLEDLSYVFCDDEYLLKINREYLNHDYYTDIITFDLSDDQVLGDIFISVDRVKENGKVFGDGFERELYRVMVHGVLHLLGYGDKSESEVKLMRSKESMYVEQLFREP